MMKPLLILKTGELPRVVTAQCGRYEQAFLTILGESRCAVVDARKETLPEPDWAGIIVTGSPASANDTAPWVAKSEDFLKRAATSASPSMASVSVISTLPMRLAAGLKKTRRAGSWAR